MKNFFSLITMLITMVASVSVSVTASAELKKYNLHYRMGDRHLEVPLLKDSYEAALEAGALDCYKFFTSQRKTTHDQKLDAVDVCANPRNS